MHPKAGPCGVIQEMVTFAEPSFHIMYSDPGSKEGLAYQTTIHSCTITNSHTTLVQDFGFNLPSDNNVRCSYREHELHQSKSIVLLRPRGLAVYIVIARGVLILLFQEQLSADGGRSQRPASAESLGQFKVNMKLEAKDRLNPHMIAVATITNIRDGKLLIHFDGWTTKYDYWCKPTTPDIHPVGWCARRDLTVMPPKGRVSYTNEGPAYTL